VAKEGVSYHPRRVRRLLVAAILLTSPSLRADRLVWQAPPGCPTPAGFADLVAASAADLRGLDVHVEAAPAASGWHVRVQVRAGEQVLVRELDAASCEEAAEAAVLVVTLLGEDLAPPPPEPRPRPSPALDPERPARPRPVSLHVGANAGAGRGGLPGTAARAGGWLGVGFHDFRAEFGVDFWPEQRRALENGAGADIGLWTTTWRACWSPGWLKACAGIELGALHAGGFGAPFTDTGQEPWQAGLASLGLHWKPSPRLGLGLAAEIARPLRRAVFEAESRELFVVEAWNPRLAVWAETPIF
jgi:hypothetical protein